MIDRQLADAGPQWLRDALEETATVVRTWHESSADQPYFDLHRLAVYRKQYGVPLQRGHFDGKRGHSGAHMAREVFALVRQLRKDLRQRNQEPIEAVVLIWDMDGDAGARRQGLDQARTTLLADKHDAFAIVYGCPDFEREAWVLAGFEAESEAESAALSELRAELGFSPVTESHRLTAQRDHDPHGGEHKKSAKRVLARLTSNDPDREQRCWRHMPLQALRARGGDNGLASYLDEVRQTLLPLWMRPSPRP
ncbi:MAG: hypothetical protein IPI49_08015 [Myxococcales bacterium]|nr:hypothetical protein [Myxococcales bacterium]